jgi:hypothetical protein
MPESGRRLLLFVVLGCMELAALTPLCRLSFLLPDMPAAGFREALVAYGLGGALAGVVRGRGWRVIWAAGLEMLALLAGAGWTLMAVYGGLAAAFSRPGSREVLALILNLFWSGLFWYRGRKLAQLELGVGNVGARFDTGVGLLTAVALFGWGIQRPVADLENFAAAFFLLGMFALAADNRRGPGVKTHRVFATGLLLGFVGVVFTLGLGLFLLMRPLLGEAARAGLRAVGDALSPFLPLLLAILRFLFSYGFTRSPGQPREAGDAFVVSDRFIGEAEWAWWLRVGLTWLIWALLAAAAVFIIVMIMRPLLAWLFSRTPGGRKDSAGWLARISSLLKRLARLMRAALSRLQAGKRERGPAARAWRRLNGWGRRSRLAAQAVETPREYGRRLTGAFPGLAADVDALVEAYNLECYSGLVDRAAADRLRPALGRLASPRWWPRRARRWFSPENRGAE